MIAYRAVFTKLSCKDNNFMKKVREVCCIVHRGATIDLLREVSFLKISSIFWILIFINFDNLLKNEGFFLLNKL